MLMKIFKTYNEGQYGLKPWAADLIMGIIELIFVFCWLFGSFFAMIQQILNFDAFEDIVDFLNFEAGIGFVLAGLFLVWNLLVWFIKPLRTKFNFKESLWNIVFIVWTIVDSIRLMM